MKTNVMLENLIKKLKRFEVLKSPMLELALRSVDRKDFVPSDYQDEAYADHPLPIGYGQTISQPLTVAFMLELLDIREDDQILDIGCGSGWTTALIGFMVSKTGSVIGVERISELVKIGQKNIKAYNFPHVEIRHTPKGVGLPGKLFDRILVSASAPAFPHDLTLQLANGGKMVIPIRESIVLIEKDSLGNLSSKEYPGFVFVPLITT